MTISNTILTHKLVKENTDDAHLQHCTASDVAVVNNLIFGFGKATMTANMQIHVTWNSDLGKRKVRELEKKLTQHNYVVFGSYLDQVGESAFSKGFGKKFADFKYRLTNVELKKFKKLPHKLVRKIKELIG